MKIAYPFFDPKGENKEQKISRKKRKHNRAKLESIMDFKCYLSRNLQSNFLLGTCKHDSDFDSQSDVKVYVDVEFLLRHSFA